MNTRGLNSQRFNNDWLQIKDFSKALDQKSYADNQASRYTNK
jgi:hypothetical protein